MKFFKIFTLAIMVLSLGLLVTSCNETTTEPTTNPVITSVSPASGMIGDQVTIVGTGFGSEASSGSVFFGDVQAKGTVGASGSDYVSWTDTKIVVKVPASAKPTTTLYVMNGTFKSNEMPFEVGGPSSTIAAPGKLMATSLTGTATTGGIRIAWAASKDESLTNFYGYRIEITEAANASNKVVKVVTDKNTKVLDITDLKTGSIYDIKVRTLINTGLYSANAATVSWAPAVRFTNVTIYESDSQSPSGLQLYDATTKAPVALTIASGAKWDLGLDTKGGKFNIGAPSMLSYTKIPNPRKTTLYMPDPAINGTWVGGSSLDASFDTDLLLAAKEEQQIEFTDVKTSFVFAVKTADGNFAKILVKANNGVILQGTAPNRYINVDVSYQTANNVPYAY